MILAAILFKEEKLNDTVLWNKIVNVDFHFAQFLLARSLLVTDAALE